VAFPCNQFGGQEPGTNEEIKAHVEETYGITFDMMSKINVNGPTQHPVYEWMINSDVGKGLRIQWNFTNFLIDRCGRVRHRHDAAQTPITWEDEVQFLLAESADDC